MCVKIRRSDLEVSRTLSSNGRRDIKSHELYELSVLFMQLILKSSF